MGYSRDVLSKLSGNLCVLVYIRGIIVHLAHWDPVYLPINPGRILSPYQNRFVLEGALEVQDQGQNARFGSALAPVPDLNGDTYNDVVIGAPLEDNHRGAIYIFYSQRNRILRKYKQVKPVLELWP